MVPKVSAQAECKPGDGRSDTMAAASAQHPETYAMVMQLTGVYSRMCVTLFVRQFTDTSRRNAAEYSLVLRD